MIIKPDLRQRARPETSYAYTSALASMTKPDQETQMPPTERKSGKRLLLVSILIAFVIITAFASVWSLRRQENLGKLRLVSNFTLKELSDYTFQLSNFTGKVVVIDFMATWCSSCRMQLFQDKTIVEKYGNRIVMMSVSIDPYDSEIDLKALAQQFSYPTWLWARDTANLANAYGVSAIPKTVIIDKDDYIRFEHVGLVDASDLISKIDQLLA